MPRATTTRMTARPRNAWSATSLSAMTMISADRMKSVRTAPETTVSSSTGPASAPLGAWWPPPTFSQTFSAPS